MLGSKWNEKGEKKYMWHLQSIILQVLKCWRIKSEKKNEAKKKKNPNICVKIPQELGDNII